jgi:uncharacterized membrane protein YfcA
MMLEPLIIFELAVLGLFTGFMAGLLGIGGGMIMVPFLTVVLSVRHIPDDLGLKMAIATAMSTIIFTSISSVRAHHQKGAVRWPLVRSLAPGLVLGSMVSSLGVFTLIKGQFLGFFFALFVAFSATQMFLDRKPKPTRQLPGPVGLLGAGGFIGFLSGLVGAGGAFVSVPFMAWCNVLIPNAVATSAALGFPIALSNTVGYVFSGWNETNLPVGSLGYVWLPGAVVISVCSVITAPAGARAAHRLPVKRLKQIFAVMLYVLSAFMLYRSFTH